MEQTVEKLQAPSNNKLNGTERLKIITKQEFTQKSPMNAEKKKQLENQPALSELLTTTLKEKGELKEDNIEWIDHETVRLKNVSNLAVHSFVLQAESLGKNVTYTNETSIRISN